MLFSAAIFFANGLALIRPELAGGDEGDGGAKEGEDEVDATDDEPAAGEE